jgi:hypothetical protein
LPTFANSVVESVRKQNRGLYCSFRWRYSVGRGGGPSKKPDGIPLSFCLHDDMPSCGFANANLTGCRHVFLQASPAVQTGYLHL